MNKPFILTKRDTDRLCLISSAERLAILQVKHKAYQLEKQADRLREQWEKEANDDKKIVLRATAVAILGQARGMRYALGLVRKGRSDDAKITRLFRRN